MTDEKVIVVVCPYNGEPCEFRRCIRLEACSYQQGEAEPLYTSPDTPKNRCISDTKGPKRA